MNNPTRWKQRFENFEKTYAVFQRRVHEYRKDPDNEAFQMALIQSFEMIVELSWKTLKDYLESEGLQVGTPKDVIRQAFQSAVITDGEVWMEALRQRNLSSHTYIENTASTMLKFINLHFDTAAHHLHGALKSRL